MSFLRLGLVGSLKRAYAEKHGLDVEDVAAMVSSGAEALWVICSKTNRSLPLWTVGL